MSRSRRVLIVAFASLFAVAFLGALLYAFIASHSNPFDDRSFDPDLWRRADPDTRAQMSDDLVKHHLPAGMKESEVIELLGEPHSIERGQTLAPRRVGTRHLLYDLGHSMAGMDACYVYVHLDEKGVVVAAEVYGY